MSSMICFLTAMTDVMVCAIMSMGIQMMTSLLPPNAAQLLMGTSTRPGTVRLDRSLHGIADLG